MSISKIKFSSGAEIADDSESSSDLLSRLTRVRRFRIIGDPLGEPVCMTMEKSGEIHGEIGVFDFILNLLNSYCLFENKCVHKT
jgi:hypothetical protein